MAKAEAVKEVLFSGKTSFKIEVPYELVETGDKGGDKPLIIYLHGYGDYLKSFKKKNSFLLNLDAYHLFIQGPYPVFDPSSKKPLPKWGRSWYLYDGRQKQFIKSLEVTSEFIQGIVDNLIRFIQVSRICVIGFSMGGYLAGYFALTRWKYVNDLVVSGGRIKSEILSESDWENLQHLNILAVHGKNDRRVVPELQEEVINDFINRGIHAGFVQSSSGHTYGKAEIEIIYSWLRDLGY